MKKILAFLLAASAVSAVAQVGDTSYTLSQQKSQNSNLKGMGDVGHVSVIGIINDTNAPVKITVADADHLDCQVGGYNTDNKWWNCGNNDASHHGNIDFSGLSLAPGEKKIVAISRSAINTNPSLSVNLNDKPGFAISVDQSAYDDKYKVGGNKQSYIGIDNKTEYTKTLISGAKLSVGAYQVIIKSLSSYDQSGIDKEVHILPHDTKSYNSADANNQGDALHLGQSLSAGKELVSYNGFNKLIVQNDGNVVLYNPDQLAVWDTMGKRTTLKANNITLQGDGNLVAYTVTGQVAWASNTAGTGADRLSLQDDGNLVLYKGSTPVWSTGTVYQ